MQKNCTKKKYAKPMVVNFTDNLVNGGALWGAALMVGSKRNN